MPQTMRPAIDPEDYVVQMANFAWLQATPSPPAKAIRALDGRGIW